MLIVMLLLPAACSNQLLIKWIDRSRVWCCQVGAPDLEQEAVRPIVDDAVEMLRSGKSISEVQSMVDAWLALCFLSFKHNGQKPARICFTFLWFVFHSKHSSFRKRGRQRYVENTVQRTMRLLVLRKVRKKSREFMILKRNRMLWVWVTSIDFCRGWTLRHWNGIWHANVHSTSMPFCFVADS